MGGESAVTKSVCKSITAAAQQQRPCFKLLPCFVPVVAVYACLVGVQQEIEPRRQQLHVHCNNQTHLVGSHTRYVHEAISTIAKSVVDILFGHDSWPFLCSLGTALIHIV